MRFWTLCISIAFAILPGGLVALATRPLGLAWLGTATFVVAALGGWGWWDERPPWLDGEPPA